MRKDIEPLIPQERIQSGIYFIRGQKVMLDSDLSKLYGVATKDFNRAVKRNPDRFPGDFMFRLTAGEFENLRCQFGTSSWGGRRFLPHAFTEQGVAMLSSVLRSQRAIRVNIEIVRAFVRLRGILSSHKDLAEKLARLEGKYDAQFREVFGEIRALMCPPEKKRPRIGFQAPKRS